MPSLRRTFSSPVVRSSPYPSYSSSSALYNAGRAQGGHGHRRSSGSDSSARRVLADIEWWKVADGQRLDHGTDDYQVDDDLRDHPPEQSGSVVATAPISSEDLSTTWSSSDALLITTSLPEEQPAPPTDQFAELSIRPRTPDSDDDDDSISSLLATPESIFLPLEALALKTTSPVSSQRRDRRRVTMPVFPTKTKLYDNLFFNDIGDGDLLNPYADFSISPLSSHAPLLLN